MRVVGVNRRWNTVPACQDPEYRLCTISRSNYRALIGEESLPTPVTGLPVLDRQPMGVTLFPPLTRPTRHPHRRPHGPTVWVTSRLLSHRVVGSPDMACDLMIQGWVS